MKLSAFTLFVSALLAACGASQDEMRTQPRAPVVTAACADDTSNSPTVDDNASNFSTRNTLPAPPREPLSC